jgi:hypothetical protein
MGDVRLAKVLTPVIYHLVPDRTLACLQTLFHAMIREDCKTASRLVLPELVTLTELKVPEMWFPLKYKDAKEHANVSSLGTVIRMHDTHSKDRVIGTGSKVEN